MAPATDTAVLRLELLGTPRIVGAGTAPVMLERRDAALLALLALRGAVPRQRALALIWPDTPVKAAQNNLRQRLFRMRRRLGTDIVVSRPVLALADGVAHDLQPGAAAPDGTERPLLGELEFDDQPELAAWVHTARAEWRLRQQQWLAREASALEDQGSVAAALALAQRLAAIEPTAEHAHRRVMRLHYRRGDRAAALAAYAHCCAVLLAELGVRPGDETLALAALIERSDTLPPPVASPSPVSALRPPRLVGRAAAWSALEAAWRDARVPVVRGEAGIGKSRLVGDFVSARGRGLGQRAQPGDDATPYALAARILGAAADCYGLPDDAQTAAELARWVPAFGAPAVGRPEPHRLRRAWAGAFAQWQREGLEVLAVDDLHFADGASLELLIAWLQNDAGPQVVLAVRRDAVPAPLRAWLDAAPESRAAAIDLGPLERSDLEALLASLDLPGLDAAAAAATLERRAGGNPLFVLEMLRTACAGTPSARVDLDALAAPVSLLQQIERRLALLPAEALRLARVAAIAGADFTPQLAARVLGVHVLDLADPWAVLEGAQVVHAQGFTHDLMLEAVARGVPLAVARPLHAAVAQALDPRTAEPARVALHWQQAQCWPEAAAAHERAAVRAAAAGRYLECVADWDAAAACHAQAGQRQGAFAARWCAAEAAVRGHVAADGGARIARLVEDASSDAERVRALVLQGRYLAVSSDSTGAIEVAQRTAELALRVDDRDAFRHAEIVHGMSLARLGRNGEALARFEALAGEMEEETDAELRTEFASGYGSALLISSRPREAVGWIERALVGYEALGDVYNAAVDLGNLAFALGHLGEHERALACAERSHDLHLRTGTDPETFARIVATYNLGLFRVGAGRYGGAIEAVEQVMQGAARLAPNLITPLENLLATTWLRIGQPARAHGCLTPAAEARASSRLRRAVVECRVAGFARAPDTGPLRAAIDALGPEVAPLDRHGAMLALAAFADAGEAVQLAGQVHAEAQATNPSITLAALARLADAHKRAGQDRAAFDVAQQALEASVHSSWHDIAPEEFWWMLHRALDTGRDRRPARAALERGVAFVETALPHVPPPFRDSYRHRSAAVPQLMAAAQALSQVR